MMMGMMTSGILGPFANYFIPIMIGARRMAFPRIEALTFWLLMAAGAILTTTIFFGGFPTGWTGYAAAHDQGEHGDGRLHHVLRARRHLDDAARPEHARDGRSRCARPGSRGRGCRSSSGASISTAVLMVLAAPVLIATLAMAALDRTVQTSSSSPPHGGSELPVREPLLGLRAPGGVHPRAARLRDRARAAAGLLAQAALGLPARRRRACSGSSLLSWFVWQHHLFVSGINADLRPFYMLSTELISIPTGFTFLCGMMTLWRGKIRYTVPMLFCLAGSSTSSSAGSRASSSPTCRAT